MDGFSAAQMTTVGLGFIGGWKERIAKGLDAYDQPAPPLSDKGTGRRYSIKQGQWIKYRTRGYASAKRTMKRKGGLSVTPFDPANPKASGEIRDWNLTGQTLRALGVLAASKNRCVVGFNPTPRQGGRGMTAVDVVRMNQRKARQWAVSPKGMKDIMAAIVRQQPPAITVRKAA